ncbi:MAG: thiamine phosphate synthase, partial [Actinomycetota bacterium]|nr:thiamine phosphate synthase [Actinomycetota bacterium]
AGLLVLAGVRGPAVHLSSVDPLPSPRPALVGRSCHDADQVGQAAAEGCDYVTLSPVFASSSKPGYGPALGPAGFARLLPAASPPAYALGGILPEHVASCRAAGAHGIAAMGPVMRDPGIVSAYLDALSEVAA